MKHESMELDGQKARADRKHPLQQLQDKPLFNGAQCLPMHLRIASAFHRSTLPRPHAHRAPTVGNSTNKEGSILWRVQRMELLGVSLEGGGPNVWGVGKTP